MDSNFEKIIATASRWRGNFKWSAAFLGDAIEAHDCARGGRTREPAILGHGYSQLKRQFLVAGSPEIGPLEFRFSGVSLSLKLTDCSG